MWSGCIPRDSRVPRTNTGSPARPPSEGLGWGQTSQSVSAGSLSPVLMGGERREGRACVCKDALVTMLESNTATFLTGLTSPRWLSSATSTWARPASSTGAPAAMLPRTALSGLCLGAQMTLLYSRPRICWEQNPWRGYKKLGRWQGQQSVAPLEPGIGHTVLLGPRAHCKGCPISLSLSMACSVYCSVFPYMVFIVHAFWSVFMDHLLWGSQWVDFSLPPDLCCRE